MYDIKCDVNYCAYASATTDASEYLLLRTIKYLILEAVQSCKQLDIGSWCTCKITALFLRMKRCIHRPVGAYFFGPPCIYYTRWDKNRTGFDCE